MSGLRAHVFKTPLYEHCSNGGISARCDEVTIMNADGPSEPTPDAPAVLLVANGPGMVRAVPAVRIDDEWHPLELEDVVGPAMGGAYVASPCTPFSDATEEITGAPFYGAVALHDRFETTAEYAVFSS